MPNVTGISAGTRKAAIGVFGWMTALLCIALMLFIIGGIFGIGPIFWLLCLVAGGVTGFMAIQARYLLIVIGALALLKILSLLPYSRSPFQAMDTAFGVFAFVIPYAYFRLRRKKW